MDILISTKEGDQAITGIRAASRSTIKRWRRSLGVQLVQVDRKYFYSQNDLQLLKMFARLLKDGNDYTTSIIEVLTHGS